MIFIDTGGFIARYIQQDPYHDQAVSFWDKLCKGREACFTSNFVLDETFTLLGRRAGYDFAAQRALSIYASEILTILRPTPKDEIRAIELFRKYADQRVSFTDCTSFVLMRRNKIKRVFSFDRHFEQVDFKLHP